MSSINLALINSTGFTLSSTAKPVGLVSVLSGTNATNGSQAASANAPIAFTGYTTVISTGSVNLASGVAANTFTTPTDGFYTFMYELLWGGYTPTNGGSSDVYTQMGLTYPGASEILYPLYRFEGALRRAIPINQYLPKNTIFKLYAGGGTAGTCQVTRFTITCQ